jgi:outer membrane protein insertion porin family
LSTTRCSSVRADPHHQQGHAELRAQHGGQPDLPEPGKRLTASIDLAVLGGNTQFYKPRLEYIYFHRHLPRTSFGFRAQTEYIRAIGQTESLPIFERLFLGGEYSVRGYDIRSIGPTVPGSVVVLGGNKSLLFNAEYLISIVNRCASCSSTTRPGA